MAAKSAALVQISTQPVDCQPDWFDLFVALDWEKVDQFAPADISLDQTSIVLTDSDAGAVPQSIAKAGARIVQLRMTDPDATRLEKAMRGKRTNVYAAGLVAALAGLSSDHLRSALADVLGAKSADVIEANMAALAAGIHGAAGVDFSIGLAPADSAKRWLITGNQAVASAPCARASASSDVIQSPRPQILSSGSRRNSRGVGAPRPCRG